jgi:hypothetical protein
MVVAPDDMVPETAALPLLSTVNDPVVAPDTDKSSSFDDAAEAVFVTAILIPL